MSKLSSQILTRKEVAKDFLSSKRDLWDNAEKLFHGQLNDSLSSGTKSQVFDPKLSTLTLERSYRVMSQLPTGKVRGISKNDRGMEKLMNLTLDKWVLPNSNAQFDFLTKMRMVDLYSNIYGNFFSLIDWDVRKNGYTGPDIWLLNIRDVFPQVGAVSVEDSDYIIVRTWRPLSYFEGLRKQDGYKNVSKIINKLKEGTGSRHSRTSDDKSKREERDYPEEMAAKKSGYFEVLTQYERDRWVDYSVEADMEFRDQKNPHEDDELPVVCKYSIPLLDDFMGFGDFERGGPMQMVINSIWNLYLDAAKISIFPPILVNKDNIASMSSIKWGAAEKWLVRNQINNSVQTVPLSPQGIAEFNNTYQVANAAILNLFGTTDTTVTAETEAGFGKTPQALKSQAARENSRDNADRFFMEQFLVKVMRKFTNLLSKKQSKAITFRLFREDLDQLIREYPEVEELYNDKTGKLTIDKSKTGSVLYDYEIVTGSTFAVDQKSQQDNLSMLMQLYLRSQTPQGNMLAVELDREGFILKFGELFKRVISNSGIQDWDKILVEKTEDEKADGQVEQDAQTFMQALQQIQTGGVQQVPPEQQAPLQGQGPPPDGPQVG
jgi:hypothetical protein